MYRVFVYGTLKRRQPNHYLMENIQNGKATFVGEGITEHKYPLIVASRWNIPFLLNVQGKGENIHGEVFDVDEQMLECLDELECHPVIYRREELKVLVKGESTLCNAYFLHSFKPELLSLPFMDKYDYYSQPDGKKYVHSSERHDFNREQFWMEIKQSIK